MHRGMRAVCHTALVGFVVLSGLLALTTLVVPLTLEAFWPWLAVLLYLFGLITPNFNAIVLEPMGEIAGFASSVHGFVTTMFAAIGGWIVGSAYDGTLVPFAVGFTVLSTLALVLIYAAEGRSGMFVDVQKQTA